MKYILLICSLVLLSIEARSQTELYFPPTTGNEWETMTISELDWCQEKVDSLFAFLENNESKSFIVLKDGKMVLEKYFGTYTQDSTFQWFSAGKSFRALQIGIAQQEGLLSLDDKTSDHLGEAWSGLTAVQEDSITIWHQLTMTSGLDETNFSCVIPSCLNYVAPVGTRWAYHNGPYNLLKNIIENASGQTINIFSNTRVENFIGMNGFWLNLFGSSIYISKARDMARFGLLIANQGVWDDIEILSDKDYWNDMLNSSQNLNPSYGYLWWLNGKSSFIPPDDANLSILSSIAPDAPSDVYGAAGSQGQYVSVSPSLGLIMIRQGRTSDQSLTDFTLHNEIWKRILDLSCTTSNTEENNLQTFNFFPNPSSSVLTFTFSDAKEHEVSIYDLLGKKVYCHITSAEKELSIDHLERGIYFVQCDGSKEMKKFIKL